MRWVAVTARWLRSGLSRIAVHLEIPHHFNSACADLPRERLVVAVDKARERTVRIVW